MTSTENQTLMTTTVNDINRVSDFNDNLIHFRFNGLNIESSFKINILYDVYLRSKATGNQE